MHLQNAARVHRLDGTVNDPPPLLNMAVILGGDFHFFLTFFLNFFEMVSIILVTIEQWLKII